MNGKQMTKAVMPHKTEWCDSSFAFHPGHASWSKRGGYAGQKVLERIREKAKAAGFVNRPADLSGNTPDGSSVWNGSEYVHPDGWRLTMNEHYGSTAYDNGYSATLYGPLVAKTAE